MSGLTANLKKNDNNNSHVTIPSVGKTGRDVTSRDQLYLTQLRLSKFGVARELALCVDMLRSGLRI